jgi:PKD domain-containing protein
MRLSQVIAGRSRWAVLAIAAVSAVAMFVATSPAQAVVVTDQGTTYGVALVPGVGVPGTQTGQLAAAGLAPVTSSGPCTDPWLAADFFLPSSGLCWHSGGSVIHANETFALTWDAPTAASQHGYWAGTRGYLEGMLRDVASGSGSLTSPFALTPQYQDGHGRAGNTSAFGGGCIDYGTVGGSACEFGAPTGAGHDFPQPACTPTTDPSVNTTNSVCLTAGQIQAELSAMISQAGIEGHTQPGYSPLVVLLLPPGVETCLDTNGNLCSVNSTAPAQLCSYHSQVLVGGIDVSYVVQPWTAFTACDDPSVPKLAQNPTPQQLAVQAGMRIANPMSQGMLAAIVNPALNGWFALNQSEINDNGGCVGLGDDLDKVTIGDSGQNPYYIQREYNNGGAISNDPNTYFGCAPGVLLTPSFVVPSAVNQGDVVAFDGSSTATTLLVPSAGYAWDFGDGTTASGPSVEHSYAKGGTYQVTLTVTDRGGNKASLSQTIIVLGASGQLVPSGTGVGQQGNAGGGNAAPLKVRIQLMPQGLRQVLRSGIAVRLSSNGKASGFAWIKVAPRTAKRLHLRAHGAREVVIAQGTVSEISSGNSVIHLHLSRHTAARLRHMKHVTLTVTLQLVGAAGDRLVLDAAGRY